MFHFGSTARYPDHVNRKLPLIVVKRQFEAICQQLLHHGLHLFLVWTARRVGLGLDVIEVGAGPGGCIDQLFGMQPISKGNQIVQIGIAGVKTIPPKPKPLAALIGSARLDGGDFEAGVGIRVHRRNGGCLAEESSIPSPAWRVSG